MFIALLLMIPAIFLVLLPVARAAALPVAIVVYAIFAVALVLLSPTIAIEDGRIRAGRAQMPVAQLGSVELLGQEALRAAIGPGADARNYLLLRGWIHRGVRIENIDPADPAPAWILTTRHPEKLSRAIDAAR